MNSTATFHHILLVEDEPDIADLIQYHLMKASYKVTKAHDGQRAIELAAEGSFDLIVLDLMLPKVDGMTVFKEIRNKAKTKNVPIIMLTAKGQASDRVSGLEAGADDYITKPFSPKELVLRIQKQLLHVKKMDEDYIYTMQDITFDKMNLILKKGDETIDLTSTEFKLLIQLCKHPNKIQTRATLLEKVWGYTNDTHTRTLDTHMKRIRVKAGSLADSIKTVRGKGYMYFVEE